MGRLVSWNAGLVLATGLVTFSVAYALGAAVWNAVFLAVLLLGLSFVLQLAWLARTGARLEQHRADQLRSASPVEVARSAVNAERERLSRDIEVWLRDLLNGVATRAAAALDAADPRPDLVGIQGDAQRATSELRRQLGLLRPVGDEGPPGSLGPTAVVPRLMPSDVVLAVVVAALSALETRIYGPAEGGVTLGSTVLSIATALLVLGRHRAPIAAGLACSALLATGALVDRPVYDGFWFPLAIGILAWALTGLQSRAGWLTLTLLTVCALGSRWLYVRDNVGINAVCLAVAVLGAAGVARSRRLRTAAQDAATERSAELRLAAEEAVRAERLQVARELHDLMSHAVSVIAVQAGAAELLWPDDPAAARRAIGIVASTARQTVAELDRLLPGRGPVHRTMTDVSALVARMADAGLAVRLSCDGDPPPELVATIYRVVQESLTNALRYAPDGAVDVDIRTTRDSLDADTTRVDVTTYGAPAAEQGRRGYGLVGLGERVAQSGGTLEISRRPEANLFGVTAVLPWRSPASTP